MKSSEKKTNLNVLIIDDDRMEQVIISKLMNTHSKVIEGGADPFEFEQSLKKDKYDIVFLDVNLIHFNGIDFLTKFKHEMPQSKAFFVVITSNIDYKKRALDAGANDFLPKPISREDIIRILERQIYFKTNMLNEDEKRLKEKGDILLSPLPFEPELLAKVVPKFLNTFTEKEEAIEKAIQSNDMETVFESAHSLKGCVGYFANTWALEPFIKLERAGKESDLDEVKKRFSEVQTTLEILFNSLNPKGSRRGA